MKLNPLAIAMSVILVCVSTTKPAADPPPPEIAVIVHAENRAAISASDLEGMFLRRIRDWSDGSHVIPFNYGPDDPVRRRFDRVVLGMSPDEVARYWLDQRIRSGMSGPREVADPVLAVKLVSRLKGAIAYVPISTNVKGVRVVAVIKDGKLVFR